MSFDLFYHLFTSLEKYRESIKWQRIIGTQPFDMLNRFINSSKWRYYIVGNKSLGIILLNNFDHEVPFY